MKYLFARSRERVNVVVAVALAFVGGTFPFALLGSEGFWWTKIFVLEGLTFLLVALSVGAVLAAPIVRRPWTWSISAAALIVVLSFIWLWQASGTSVGLIATLPALLASCVFNLVLKTVRALEFNQPGPPAT